MFTFTYLSLDRALIQYGLNRALKQSLNSAPLEACLLSHTCIQQIVDTYTAVCDCHMCSSICTHVTHTQHTHLVSCVAACAHIQHTYTSSPPSSPACPSPPLSPPALHSWRLFPRRMPLPPLAHPLHVPTAPPHAGTQLLRCKYLYTRTIFVYLKKQVD